MAFFIPSGQLQNMIDAEVGQALCGRPNLGKLIALATLQHNHVPHQFIQPIQPMSPYGSYDSMDCDDYDY